MPYRRTDNVIRKQAARHRAIIESALLIASEGGMGAVQIAPVAQRAGIAAGTVYRYFPSKTELVGALIEDIALREMGAMQRAADAAPGPVSALAAAIATFAARALRNRRLAWAVIAEPVDAEVEVVRLKYRRGLAGEVQKRIDAAMAAAHVPRQDTALAAPALVGALLEGLIGPLAPQSSTDENAARAAVQTLTLLSLRALGVVDARARGLVVQTVLPLAEESS
jgi:AcrR family transcriptional regulator